MPPQRDLDQYQLIGAALGISRLVVQQKFALYFPNKDRRGHVIDVDVWIKRALQLLTMINGGATAFPAAQGMWLDEQGNPLDEYTVIVYSFIDPDRFFVNLPVIRAFLHRFGKETDQGELLVEFGEAAFWIRSYDTL